MRTIVLLLNKRGKWFVHVRVGGEIISTQEDFPKAFNARRAFFAEGDNQPQARMVIERPDWPVQVVRKGSRVVKGIGGPYPEKSIAMVMKPPFTKPH
jgi:hypothetical protein